MDFLRVSSKSSPASVAGAIAGLVKDGKPARIQSIGAGALNQAIKAVAIANSFLNPEGYDVSAHPEFAVVPINGESRTAIRMELFVRRIEPIPAPAKSGSSAGEI